MMVAVEGYKWKAPTKKASRQKAAADAEATGRGGVDAVAEAVTAEKTSEADAAAMNEKKKELKCDESETFAAAMAEAEKTLNKFSFFGR